jgi:hypothetical protein
MTNGERNFVLQLMSKMAPLIGRSSTERLFLSRFTALCTDPVFYVRKACAANFGEFCAIVGTESTESALVSTCIKFIRFLVHLVLLSET